MATLNFNQDQCILCGQCVEKCPFGALEILDNKIEINASCKMCKLCVKSCPVQAVSLVEDEVKKTVEQRCMERHQWYLWSRKRAVFIRWHLN